MTEASMHDLGIFAWFGYRLPLDERLALIAEAGFNSTALWLGDEEDHVVSGLADRMPVLAREFGLAVDNVHAPFVNCDLLWSDAKDEIDIIREEYGSALYFCDRHDIRRLVIHISGRSAPPAPSDRGMDLLRELTAYAKDHDIVVAIENTRRLDYIDAVLSNIESPHLGLCYDSSHDALCAQAPGRILEKWGHRLVTTHLSDSYGREDNHFLPGNGTIDWSAIAECFPSETYSGPIMFEVVPKNTDDIPAAEFLRIAYNEAVRLRGMLCR